MALLYFLIGTGLVALWLLVRLYYIEWRESHSAYN